MGRLRQQIEAFAEEAVPGSKLRLKPEQATPSSPPPPPPSVPPPCSDRLDPCSHQLDARERRLLHTWAEAQGIDSKSSGKKGRGEDNQRRLTLSVPPRGKRRGAADADAAAGTIVSHAGELEAPAKGRKGKDKGGGGGSAAPADGGGAAAGDGS